MNVDVKNTNEKVLTFKKWPCTQWVVGLIVFSMGVLMLYYLAVGMHDPAGFAFMRYHQNRSAHWWHYLTAVILLVLGLIFVYSGKI